MINRLFIITVFIFMVQPGICQFQVDWQQCYCGLEADRANDIVKFGNEFIVIGTITEAPSGGQVTCTNENASWLIKINDTGELIWQQCYFHFGGYRMQKAIGSQYYYITGGTIMDPYPDAYNVFVGKFDSLGSIIWERSLGNDTGQSDYHHFGTSTTDGGFVATADIFSQGGDITTWYGGYDGWVIKLDSMGNTDWDFTMGSQMSEFVIGITQTLDDGYIVCGAGTPDGVTGNISTASFDTTHGDAVIFKLDSEGNPIWNKTFGGSESDISTRAVSLENGYLIAGSTFSNDGYLEGLGWHGLSDIWLIRTDLNGEIIWQKCYGGSQIEGVSRVFSTSDGGFLVFGSTHSFDGDIVGNPSNSTEKSSIWIFKVNSAGDLIWQQCVGGFGNEDVNGVIQHSDYNYTLAGEMTFSPSVDVNCSNFIPASGHNYWVLGISDTTVNIRDNKTGLDKINIYPNPTNEILNIDFPNNFNLKKTSIKLLDINSRITIDFEPLLYNNKFSMSKLKPGLYILKIQSDKSYIIEKVLIQ